jgi:hypothetical protein
MPAGCLQRIQAYADGRLLLERLQIAFKPTVTHQQACSVKKILWQLHLFVSFSRKIKKKLRTLQLIPLKMRQTVKKKKKRT